MAEPKQNWCPIPWKGLNIRNNGDFRVCCHANSSGNKGTLKDSEGNILNARTADLNQVRNSPLLKEIRTKMLRNERHETCLRCNTEDDTGIRSRRTYETEFWSKSFGMEEAKESTGSDGSIFTQLDIGHLDIRFGNLCNLKCRMCGPTDSSFWQKEHFETISPFFHDTSGKVHLENRAGKIQIQGENPYEWYLSDHFWNQMEKNLSGVQKIYCVGGEPLLIDRHFDLLKKLVESGHSKNVIMDYNSNITVIPPKALELWKHFKEVRVGASLDGVGKINDYIRNPSKWAVAERNLDLLDKIEGNITVWIAATIQIYNIYYLTDFLKWRIEKNFARVNNIPRAPFLTTHPLHTPKHFSIKALPPQVKIMVAEKFEHFYQNWFLPYMSQAEITPQKRQIWMSKMKPLLDGYRDLMNSEDLSHHLPQFLAATQRMDQHRKESFAETMPEIAIPIYEFAEKFQSKTIDHASLSP